MSKQASSTRLYLRFNLSQRIQHLILVISFTLLALTGLPQKYPLSPISIAIARAFGGVETLRLIHHASATALMLVTVYHLLEAGYKLFVLRSGFEIFPSFQDIKDALGALLYNLGLRKEHPQMGRYTFAEKAEYWALVWGLLVMGLTGFLMWNPILVTRYLPGEFIPAAKAAHGGEALLAVLAIILWHMYHVHIKRFNKAMWTGYLSEEEMLEEHPLELADLKAGIAGPRVDEATRRRRERIYYPVAAVVGVLLLLGVYGFVNAEQTAITTIVPPRSTEPVYVPQTPTPLPTLTPTPTPSGALPLTWNGAIGALLQQKCGQCHGSTTLGGFNLSTYASLLKGGNSGAAIVIGDPSASLLIQKQEAGDHPGKLSADELELLRQWIANGAPEN
ncbi:MAG: cytochrome b/b6 domain-containing protein [Anaerolineales bacterium]